MESMSKVENPTVPEKMVRAPGPAETVMVEGEKGKVVEAGSLVLDPTAPVDTDVPDTAEPKSDEVTSPPKVVASPLPTSPKPLAKEMRDTPPTPMSPPPSRPVEPTVASKRQ
jgi:hypothetical protein